jgi:predicted nucleic acid-binding protein
MSVDCVVDASVGIKLFLVEPLADRVDTLFSSLTETPAAHLYVPGHFYVECANILWKYVHRFGYSPENARQDVADLVRLPLRIVPTSELAEAALALALDHRITAYDATYVALAQKTSLPLVTADKALVRRLEPSGLSVYWLGEWPQ